MNKTISVFLGICIILLFASSKFTKSAYSELYTSSLQNFENEVLQLQEEITHAESTKEAVLVQLHSCRKQLKAVDFWLRYADPILHKKINGPLPVEWETEVFEKWERPYKRTSAGFTLSELYLEEEYTTDSLSSLINECLVAVQQFQNDSLIDRLNAPENFYYSNRLFLLNLATIYTTGFECPNTNQIIPELRHMLQATSSIYDAFNLSFEEYSTGEDYLELYHRTTEYVYTQPTNFQAFDHFRFIRDYVNPLFQLNQQLIAKYDLKSSNVNDYSLNNKATSIFDKSLYHAQEYRGLFKGLKNASDIRRLEKLGETLFHDPILSINNKRSCSSCHKRENCFTENKATSTQLDNSLTLDRNTPSLINSLKNHLLMLDGRHIDPVSQANEVTQNPQEMGSSESELFKKVLSVKYYKKELKHLSSKVIDNQLSAKHIYSALIAYYGSFDNNKSPFDNAMNKEASLSNDEIAGFNLFMSKGECGTCHFAPIFNGVKPPYVSSEFEVLGTPADTNYTKLSNDLGRGKILDVVEMQRAFRTPTLRNSSCTAPYMHNGVFKTLEEVLDFYNNGGGSGRKLQVTNQTLNNEKLNLTDTEIKQIIAFIKSLDEAITVSTTPIELPKGTRELRNRKTEY